LPITKKKNVTALIGNGKGQFLKNAPRSPYRVEVITSVHGVALGILIMTEEKTLLPTVGVMIG